MYIIFLLLALSNNNLKKIDCNTTRPTLICSKAVIVPSKMGQNSWSDIKTKYEKKYISSSKNSKSK